MHRPFAARAIPPLLPSFLAATLAVTALLAIGAGASSTFADQAGAQPAASSQAVAQVEGVTIGSTHTDRPVAGLTDQSTATGIRFLARNGLLGKTSWGAANAAPTSTGTVTSSVTTGTPRATATRSTSATAPVWWSRYQGTNHVWMPTLGLSKPVHFYGCSESDYPANVVYRWGCGGTNNVYLFGHNYGMFYPLYSAWKRGELKKGMPVVYADGQGRTRLYRVVTWRVLRDDQGSWAYASQPVPSMTIQTCAAKTGHDRLIVRLVSVAS